MNFWWKIGRKLVKNGLKIGSNLVKNLSKLVQDGLKIGSKFTNKWLKSYLNWLKMNSKSYFVLLYIFSRTKYFLKNFLHFSYGFFT